MALETEIAWAAGLFEGEGCVHIYSYPTKKYGLSYAVAMELCTTDLDVLEKFVEIVSAGDIKQFDKGKKGTLPHHKLCYVWSIYYRPDIRRIIDLFLPYMGMRRTMKMRDALEKMDEWDISRRTVSSL